MPVSSVKSKNAVLATDNKQLQYRAVKRKLLLTDEQANKIDQFLGCMRLVYNDLLAIRKIHYTKTGKQLSGSEYKTTRLKDLKIMKPFLTDADKFIFDDVIIRQDAAFDRFFKHLGRFPKFKSKKNSYQSYTTYQTNNNIKLTDGGIKIPKIGVLSFDGDSSYLEQVKKGTASIKKATISRDGDYYISIVIEQIVPLAKELKIQDIDNSKIIGIDVGIKAQVSCSDGFVETLPRTLKSLDKRMRRKQRSLSRKNKNSKNYKKAKNIVNKAHKKISNTRKDFNHKLSKKIISENQAIFVEDLAIKNMVKNHKLAKAIFNCGWSQLFSFLEYKAKQEGKIFHKINRFYASSQTCSCCGYVNSLLKDLKVRDWVCPNCGIHHNRDINAAINIKNRGITELSA